MITRSQLQQIASQKGVKDIAFMEKDYALTWTLKAISTNSILSNALLFKGGTCISKMYAQNYRLSEDLDFTLAKNSPFSLEMLAAELTRAFDQIKRNGGPELAVKEDRRLENNGYVSVRIRYIGPLMHPGDIKLEISMQEKVIYSPETLPIKDNVYHDIGPFTVRCYSIYEIISEKIRATMQRGKSRDYYDIWRLMSDKNLKRIILKDPSELMELVQEKCTLNEIEFAPEKIFSESRVQEAKTYWKDSLERMTPNLSEFEKVLAELRELFFSVNELSLFSADMKVEHLDNIHRFPPTGALLSRAAHLLEKELNSKKKSDVLNAIGTLSKIRTKEYANSFIALLKVIVNLTGDRDKEVCEAAENLRKKYSK